jgi:hypothetical protein
LAELVRVGMGRDSSWDEPAAAFVEEYIRARDARARRER